MSLFKEYLRCRAPAIAAYVTAMAVCFAVMPLYRVPEAALYTFLLTTFLLGVAAWGDFRHFSSKTKKLERLMDDPSLFRDFVAEERLDPTEERIFGAMGRLDDACRRETEEAAKNRRLMWDYFTAWAHNIKTPIAAMYLLLEKEEGGRKRELKEQLFKTEQYVDMAMAYARVDSPTNDFLLRRFPLDDIIHRAVKKHAPLFIGKDISVKLPPTGLTVLSDEKWLCFVLEQLISNAVKYTPAGGTVTIYSPEKYILSVSDTGPGVPPEDLPRIWERGYTGYNGHGESHSSGIGLYLSGRILSLLGHTFYASSPPHQGLTVSIDLKTRDAIME